MKGKTAGKIIALFAVAGMLRRVWWENRYYAG